MTESLAEVLRLFRSSAHLSQEALAERSGLSTRTVSDIETGSARTPRLITVMLLAEALALSPADRTRLQNAARKPAVAKAGEAVQPRPPELRPVALVGRDDDVARVCALLNDDGARLVTLVGPAGVGKTSLATRVAGDLRELFEHGVAIAELSTIDEPSLVPAAVARALGLRDSADASIDEVVNSYLRDRNTLLVLDNLEHLTPAAAWVGALLVACPRLTVIATSREALHLRSEHVYAVRPLDKMAAATLFVQRAQMVSPDFKLTAANSAAIDSIVDHLEGLPLAIELAAPRLLLLPVRALAARLERRLPLLGDGAVDRPERQQTMRGAIAWSYDLLSENEQRLFRQLSVFQGGGSLKGVASVVGDDGDDPSVLFRIAPLVDKNIISLVEDADAEPRVSMLEMLREFAHERLVESGELDVVRGRHRTYVQRFVEAGERELSGPAQGRWVARFEREHGNIRSALAHAASTNDAISGSRLTAAVWRFWWLHGHLTEGVAWLKRFLDLVSESRAKIPDMLYGKVLRAHVVLLSGLGNFQEALHWCEEAIVIQRRIGDEAGLGASLTSLGIILQFCGEYDRSEAAHTESLAIRRRIGDELGIATSLSNLSSVAFSKNDLARAAKFGEESAAIYRRLGHESGLAHALSKIGLVAAGERNYERAEQFFSECLRVQQAVGDTGNIKYTLINLGATAHSLGNYDIALSRYHEALDAIDAMPSKYALAKTLENMAATISAIGDPARGARLLGAADAARRAIRTPIAPAERNDYEGAVAKIRATLGDEAFDVQWRIGTSTTLERALEEARTTRAE